MNEHMPSLGEETPIKVSDRVVGHLSRGLYRSPASAIRELVSNAWDAGATTVRIDTSAPRFLQVTIADDGHGFEMSDFYRHMSGDIGNSFKRTSSQVGVFDRPIIGRLGIGMLGIGQICQSFIIASKTKDGSIWQARVTFRDELKEMLDKEEPSAGEQGQFNIGRFSLMEPTISIKDSGTVLVADDLHTAFVTTFRESTELPDYKKLSRDWKDCVTDVFSHTVSLQLSGEYVRLLWEMAASCPVPYISDDAVVDSLIASDHARLLSYNFRVLVDQRELRRPLWLQGHKDGYVPVRIADQHHSVYQEPLNFHGYVIAQNATQLRPDELRGILIRIKNVGIGYYDQTFMDYRTNEGPRTRWVTGEIYVDKGLEDSLNIDRDSFNKFDPEYRVLQKYIHEVLKESLFSEVNKKQDERSKQKAARQQEKRSTVLLDVIANVTAQGRPTTLSDALLIMEEPRETVVDIEEPDELKTKKSARQLASAILAIFDTTQTEEDPAYRRSKFKGLLLDLLRKW